MKIYKLVTCHKEVRYYINHELAKEGRNTWAEAWYQDLGFTSADQLKNSPTLSLYAEIQEINVIQKV